MSETIEVRVISFKDTEIKSSLPERIVLHDSHLEYKWKLEVKTPDEEVKYQGQKSVLKRSIHSVVAAYSPDSEVFFCAIFTLSEGGDTTWHFETLKEAIEVKDKIFNWLTFEPKVDMFLH